MLILAAPLLAATAAVAEVRGFWRPADLSGPQPRQEYVTARLAAEGRTVVVYRADGYRFSPGGAAAEGEILASIVRTFDDTISPKVAALLGTLPGRLGEVRVAVLVAPLPPEAPPFFPFDLLTEQEARRWGVHSNESAVLYAALDHAGNRASWNLARLADGMQQIAHATIDPAETGWRRMLGAYQPFLCGLATPRLLWGDDDAERLPHRPSDPVGETGWSLLLLEYLRGRFGDSAIADLVRSPFLGPSALASLPAIKAAGLTVDDLYADFAMACWLDDPGVAGGRFNFPATAPPRPHPAARALASRPSSGSVDVGVGGMAILVVDGDGNRPFPVQIQGDPSVRWVARAILQRLRGPDELLPIHFNGGGVARLELPALAPGDSVAVAVMALPDEVPWFDRRSVQLLWGVAWQPHRPVDATADQLRQLAAKGLLDGGAAARTRLLATIDLLGGGAAPGGEAAITTRYAWAPGSAQVVAAIRREAELRGLPVEISTFESPEVNGIRQPWSNVLINLPGTDPRRWPVVLAAHYDAVRSDFEESARRALGLDDNASGVAVALEAAAAMSRVAHRVPVTVALLAGGCHGAAGARNLLETRAGHITAWLELDGVGIPAPAPRGLFVRVEGEGRLPLFPWTVTQAFHHVGLVARTQNEIESPHTGAALALQRSVPSLAIRARPADLQAIDVDLPPASERGRQSADLLVLVTRAVSAATLRLAGAP